MENPDRVVFVQLYGGLCRFVKPDWKEYFIKKIVVFLLIFMVGAGFPATAQTFKKPLDLQRMFSHPRLQGYAPQGMKFSPDGKKLLFLWNESGHRFRDLYLATLPKGKIVRLTVLSGLPRDEREEDKRTREEKQEARELDRGVVNAVWTRDGKRILFSYRGDFFLIDARAGAAPVRLFHTSETERSPSFSPDGTWLAYVKKNDIFIYHMRDGRYWQVTRGGSSELRNGTGYYDSFVKGAFWSDDAEKIAFVQYDLSDLETLLIPDYVSKKVKIKEQQREIAGGLLAYTRVGIMRVDSLFKQPLWLPLPSEEEYYLRSLDWSPDNQHLLLEIMAKNQKERYLVQYAIGDTTCDTLWRETDTCWIPSFTYPAKYGPEGKSVIFGSEKSGWRHLYLLPLTPLAAGRLAEPVALTFGDWPVERWDLSRDRQAIVFTAGDGDLSERHLYSLDISSGRITPLWSPAGWIRRPAMAENGTVAAFSFADLANPFDLYWVRTDGKKPPKRLTHSPRREFMEYDWRQPEFLQFPSADGKTIHAKMYKPDGFDSSFRYPLVVYVHGAGYAQSVLKAPWWYRDLFNRVLAQEGFVVLDLDYRGSKGYGRDWRVGVYRHVGGKDLDDEVAGVRYLVDQGFVDSSRVGIWGWSYGGFMTNMAMFKAPEVFKVGCAVAAVNDWENYNLWYTTARFNYPDNDSVAFHQSSPIHFAEGLRGKLLMIHGMKDDNVHFQDMVQLSHRLIKLGKNFDVMVYPREKHGFSRDESNVHVFVKILAYFKAHL